ncbi:MAG: hypothetical protein ABWZ64_16925 [Xanthobacteraceae bacterium]
MAEREVAFRAAAITYFPMFIAALSLIAAIYGNYLNLKSLQLVESSLGKTEYLHTCKEIIDAYFQIKFLATVLSETSTEAGATPTTPNFPARLNAMNAVNKFAALGTYLANLRDAATREYYTHLSWKLEEIVCVAAGTPPTKVEALFETADAMFAQMNDDCVRTAKQ